MVATSKTILPYEPGYVGNKEAKKRHKETKERLRQRDSRPGSLAEISGKPR
jgi:hypothetical protein